MRRRLLRLLMMSLVVPTVAVLAEDVADRLEASKGPNRPATVLRYGSRLGRRYSRRR